MYRARAVRANAGKGEVNFGGGLTQGGSRCAPLTWAGIRLLWGAGRLAPYVGGDGVKGVQLKEVLHFLG